MWCTWVYKGISREVGNKKLTSDYRWGASVNLSFILAIDPGICLGLSYSRAIFLPYISAFTGKVSFLSIVETSVSSEPTISKMKFSTLVTTRDCFRYFSLVSTNWILAWFVASPITLLPCSFQSSILAPCSFVSIPWFSSCFIPILGSCTIVLSKSIYLERSLISVGKIWNWSLFIVWASWLSDCLFFIMTFPSINLHCHLYWICV